MRPRKERYPLGELKEKYMLCSLVLAAAKIDFQNRSYFV